jgi:hypothetical protein
VQDDDNYDYNLDYDHIKLFDHVLDVKYLIQQQLFEHILLFDYYDVKYLIQQQLFEHILFLDIFDVKHLIQQLHFIFFDVFDVFGP